MRKIVWGGVAAATAAAVGGLVLVGAQTACHPDSWAGRGVALALGLGGRAVVVPQTAHAAVAAAHGPVAGPCLGSAPAEPPILACDALLLTPLPPQDAASIAALPCARGTGAAPACLAGRIVIDESTAVPFDLPGAMPTAMPASMPAVRDGGDSRWAAGAEESEAGSGGQSRETPVCFALMPRVEDEEATAASGTPPELLPAPAVREMIAAPAEALDIELQTQAIVVPAGVVPAGVVPAGVVPAGGACRSHEAEHGQSNPVPHLQDPRGCPSPGGACPSVPRTIKGREGHSGVEECEPAGSEGRLPRRGGVDTLEFRPCDRSLSAVDLRGPF